uniref:Uncharacterized protein n=1 Tax=Aegilops tauschii subsp. strangulata TaxID=200361 RepID=A0A453QPF4_AEGTS
MVLMTLGLAVFVGGSRVYRFRKLRASPFTSICQVLVAAVRKWRVQLPDDVSLLYELTTSSSSAESRHKIQHTNQFRFLDKAATLDKTCTTLPMCSWSLCTVTQVEELKILLRMFPVWASFVIFYAVAGQTASTFIEQGMVMDNHVGRFAIPPASLSIVSVLSVLIGVFIYESVLASATRAALYWQGEGLLADAAPWNRLCAVHADHGLLGNARDEEAGDGTSQQPGRPECASASEHSVASACICNAWCSWGFRRNRHDGVLLRRGPLHHEEPLCSILTACSCVRGLLQRARI